MPHPLITQADIETFQNEGVVLIKNLFANYVEDLRAGLTFNMKNPGPYAAENLSKGERGRFFDDYCNWSRIPEFKKVILEGPAGAVAADLMKSKKVQIFHDHILVKEPGTSKPTPWHQDAPYYFVEGQQTVSFWGPLDHVKDASLRCVAGATSGLSQFYQPAGLRKTVFTQTSTIICLSQIQMQTRWRSGNGKWSQAMRWLLISASYTVHVATRQPTGVELFHSV